MSLTLSLTKSGRLAITLPNGLAVNVNAEKDKVISLVMDLLHAQLDEKTQKTVGTKACPTQQIVDHFMKVHSVTKGPDQHAPKARRLVKIADGIYKSVKKKNTEISLEELLAFEDSEQ